MKAGFSSVSSTDRSVSVAEDRCSRKTRRVFLSEADPFGSWARLSNLCARVQQKHKRKQTGGVFLLCDESKGARSGEQDECTTRKAHGTTGMVSQHRSIRR